MPEPRGFGFTMRAFVDADHAGDSVTWRSRTGFLVYLNSAPIYWLSKKQSGVETTSFGSEFIAMKQCCEYLRGLRYKLRMTGIPCVLPSYVYGDNQSVLANTTVPESRSPKVLLTISFEKGVPATNGGRIMSIRTWIQLICLPSRCLQGRNMFPLCEWSYTMCLVKWSRRRIKLNHFVWGGFFLCFSLPAMGFSVYVSHWVKSDVFEWMDDSKFDCDDGTIMVAPYQTISSDCELTWVRSRGVIRCHRYRYCDGQNSRMRWQ
jgi:hypothetical protein